ncbi:SixA phosphatase family protein [Seonamhaeicola maritimus]|uniref:Histidine phosphatase family protein n=1 Tax=Seonamhaeicola maritimus TaxID=2591822 RepID=A0A5C7GFC6_9FLAO|nr:phosphoglycerate mutase family protein [Seonamhaeicola maritimus]TXG35378.1 histidine phosphatase family protein [Seonamhaeicola maritimus]
MRFLLLIFVVALTSCGKSKDANISNKSDASTYYFIRHAEKDRSNPDYKNPHLTDIGVQRAENWSKILDSIKFDLVYSTDYNRTKETAKPTALKNNIEITIYKPHPIKAGTFLKNTNGKTVLIVGHSNTIPSFVNAILKQEKYNIIEDNNNGNLYIISIINGKVSDRLISFN